MTTDYIYTILKARLLDKVPELKEVAFYYQQDEESAGKGRPIIIAPAVLIEFSDIPTRALSGSVEQTTIQFKARIITTNMYDDDKRITDTSQESHFSISRKVFQSLKGYGATISAHPGFENLKDTEQDFWIINSITRTNHRTDHRLKKKMRTIMNFTATGKDFTAVKSFQTAQPDLDITI
jgi:hypothetical protein